MAQATEPPPKTIPSRKAGHLPEIDPRAVVLPWNSIKDGAGCFDHRTSGVVGSRSSSVR